MNRKGMKIFKCEKCGKEVGATQNSIRITRRQKGKIVKIDTYHVGCWLEDVEA